jgi:multicomponent Na+:H+ antiporter subunit F
MTVLYVVVGVIFAVVAVLATVRVVMGPTILDRVIASDVLLTTLILVLGTEMVINGHTRSIALMVVLAATSTFSTVAVARYVTNQDRTDTVQTEIAKDGKV